VAYLGLKPRIALEELDSGSPRIHKIVHLIASSKYAIHDLSRLRARKAGEYYRLNMPFELGVDVGCRLFGNVQRRKKRCLILETERYRYQAALSDLSNSDIAVHGGEAENVVTEVRNWLDGQLQLRSPGPSQVWGAFLDFMADNYNALKKRGFSESDIAKLPVGELTVCIERWCQDRKARARRNRAKGR
jgi:hypothetical protein